MALTQCHSPVIASDSSHSDEYMDAVDVVSEEKEDFDTLDILYRVSWVYPGGSGEYEREDDPCPTTTTYQPPRKKTRSVISISIKMIGISTSPMFYGVNQDHFLLQHYMLLHRQDKPNPNQLKRPDKDFKAKSISVESIDIHSSHLLQAIRELVKYYPGQKMMGDFITVLKPYSMLLHYYHDLKNLRDTYVKKDERSEIDEEVAHHLSVLIDWLEPHYVDTFQVEEERHRRGVATNKLLWVLYKPGCVVYTEIGGDWRAFIVSSFDGPSINVWYISHDGNRFVRRQKELSVDPFDGERKITSLNVIPKQYIEETDQRHSILKSRGDRYAKIIRTVPLHSSYAGEAMTRTGFKLHYDGGIIVDPNSWKTDYIKSRRQSKNRSNSDSDSDSDAESILSDKPAVDTIRTTLHTLELPPSSGKENYHHIDSDDPIADWKRFESSQIKDGNSAELSANQKSLLPTHLKGFALGRKSWMIFDLKGIRDIDRKNASIALENLIIPEEDRQILTAVTRKHVNSRAKPLFSDFVHGKGEGLILLLHGPPGTGKTFTAECIAEYTCRPLISLTVADIGTKEDEMEARLLNWFNLATKWEAVLLIDEADVFLEKRALSELARNSLVSVFLRSLEYYNGMLFLTTNRVGHLDDAFLSRIQVAITYKKLSFQSQREIWKRFFRKINEEEGDVSVSWEAQEYIKMERTVESMDMNGREIRSTLQTAVALANDRSATKKTQSVVVSIDDIKQVASRRRRFIDYIDRVRGASEKERALREYDRNDD